MRIPQFIAIMWLALICALTPAHADKRVAMVVGNGAYRHADKLDSPVNDARGMRDALKQIGFDVIYGENLDHNGLRQKIDQFAQAVRGASVAIVYFGGHGATFGDTPYVVPVDAEFSSLEQVPYELIAVETLIGELRHVDGVRIAILDACRDDAAERELKRLAAGARGGELTRGLAPLKNPEGLILAYATQYLSTAVDSGGAANSPLTSALLHNIATPGLDVKELFFRVGQEVVIATDNRQRPEISISLYEPYALVPTAMKPVSGPQTPVPARASPAAAPSQDEICKHDAAQLDNLRINQKRDEVIRFERELACEKLRPQVIRLRESLAAPAPPTPADGRPEVAVSAPAPPVAAPPTPAGGPPQVAIPASAPAVAEPKSAKPDGGRRPAHRHAHHDDDHYERGPAPPQFQAPAVRDCVRVAFPQCSPR